MPHPLRPQADEATFLRALVDNKLHVRQTLLEFYGSTGGKQAGGPGNAFRGVGAGAASWAYVYYDAAGSHKRRPNTGPPPLAAAQHAAGAHVGCRLLCL